MRLVVQGMILSVKIMVEGNTDAKQQFTSNSSAWWWSHIRPHALQKVLSGGFLIRKQSSLQDNND